MLLGLVVGALVCCVFLVVAASRRGSSVLGRKTSRSTSLSARCDPEDALKTIVRFAQQSGYKVSAIDEVAKQLVLEESASATSWGFFFPVAITRQPDGSSTVEIGIKSKAVQVGPVPVSHHERMVNGIRAALFADSKPTSA